MAKKKVSPEDNPGVIHNQCSNCRFFREIGEDLGDCLRYPPTVIDLDPNDEPIQANPVVEALHCCGEHSGTIN